jgi:hypothetical protein
MNIPLDSRISANQVESESFSGTLFPILTEHTLGAILFVVCVGMHTWPGMNCNQLLRVSFGQWTVSSASLPPLSSGSLRKHECTLCLMLAGPRKSPKATVASGLC